MTFNDKKVTNLNHRTKKGLCGLLQYLCGVTVNVECPEISIDTEPCGKCQRCINWQVISERLKLRNLRSEDLNDILMLVDQFPVSEAFFKLILSSGKVQITFDELKKGIVRFEGLALLLFGNVRFAYRQLRTLDESALKKELKGLDIAGTAILKREFNPRRRGLPLPSPINSKLTWHLGYIASSKISRDIRMYAAMGIVLGFGSKKAYLATQDPRERSRESKLLDRLIARLQKSKEWKALYPDFESVKDEMDRVQATIDKSRKDGFRNTSHYLALDYMDIYVATSMRESWEFEDVHSITKEVFKHREIARLNLRYFDPTQSFLDNRVDKGLVEALMLKRARCTIYMAQETDTFGKDSELATTLAQGKPVIVFVPQVNLQSYARAAFRRPLAYLQRRLPQLLAEDRIPSKYVPDVLTFLQKTAAFDPFFKMIGEEEVLFVQEHKLAADKLRMCKVLAEVEKELFDGRASSLQRSHPLGIQVHLVSGVANGVLVVRSVQECAHVLRRLLTNTCRFYFDRDREPGILCLIETVSNSPYRVMTENSTVSNAFWSRYLSGNTTLNANEFLNDK
jgi:hypothetical protein